MRIARAVVDGRTETLVATDKEWRVSRTPVADLIAGAAVVAGCRVVDPRFLAPLEPGNVIGIGLNFHDTIRDMGWEPPTAPYLFAKFASSVVGPEDEIRFDPTVTRRVDWEAELAVVIGRTASRVTAAEALDHVFGYTGANDISARDLQESDGQWIRGKAMDTFCPLGPVMVTSDEVPDPQAVRLRTWVNGALKQDGTTKEMVFSVDQIISYVSQFVTLQPGDVILTGTPTGCGDYLDPREALRDGDRVEVDVEGIGRLRNRVSEIVPLRDT